MSKNNTKIEKKNGSGAWLYDFLMKGIEPDLLQDEVTLTRRYVHETPIDHDARMDRYKNAFQEYDRVLGLMTGAMVREAQKEKAGRRRALGMEEQLEQTNASQAAEQSLDSFDA
jgi:hypothetical protein